MKKIKKRSQYRSTIRLDLTLYASVSFIFVVVYEIWLIHIPAIFPLPIVLAKYLTCCFPVTYLLI